MKTNDKASSALPEMLGDSLVDLRQVAGVLGVSVRSVNRLIAAKDLPSPVKVGGSSRFYLSDLKVYLASLRTRYRKG